MKVTKISQKDHPAPAPSRPPPLGEGKYWVRDYDALFTVLFLAVIFANNLNPIVMQTARKNTGIYWLIFFISTALFIVAIIFHFSYLTLLLPFMCTAFVKAMNII